MNLRVSLMSHNAIHNKKNANNGCFFHLEGRALKTYTATLKMAKPHLETIVMGVLYSLINPCNSLKIIQTVPVKAQNSTNTLFWEIKLYEYFEKYLD